jgi:mono/diheme cytochrome c family protein
MHAGLVLMRRDLGVGLGVDLGVDLGVLALLLIGVLAAPLACATPVAAQPAATPPDDTTIDVNQLFASTCGWCHSDGGKAAGKGPQLMNSPRTDDYLRNRIKIGKEGAMPAFGEAFSEAQIDAIIKYIRSLKPDQG